MARKQRSKGKGPGGPQAQGAAAQQRPQGSGGGGWGPLRDSIRRDIEQAIGALAFAERLHQKMDTQRRVFLDFPRAMEQLRSGAMERVAVALSRLYEGGQGFDLQRFLRDLPLALAQLAAADRSKSGPPPQSSASTAAAPAAAGSESEDGSMAAAEAPSATAEGTATVGATPAPSAEAAAAAAPQPSPEAPAKNPEPAADSAAAAAQPVSPRLELRAKLLAAAPQLAKAATSYRRNVATLKRAALPRRSPGPWRADREVLEEARRAVEFVQKLYDAYAEAWADQPLTPNLHEQTTDELDRFLAWTQLDRYVELAVLASTNAPRPPKPGQQILSAPRASTPPHLPTGPESSAPAAEAATQTAPATENAAADSATPAGNATALRGEPPNGGGSRNGTEPQDTGAEETGHA